MSDVPSERPFLGVAALVFAASAAGTASLSASMSAMGRTSMPGGWTMSMIWMRMPGQTWLAAGAAFLGMWTVMMAAMMLPSLVPMLVRYRRAVADAAGDRLAMLTALVGSGYFVVWAGFGMAAFPLGVALAAGMMQRPGVASEAPVAAGVAVVLAGAFQFTEWKAYHLACCREMPAPGRPVPPGAGGAWRHGVELGLHCARCCAGLMAVLLVVGAMDLRVMVAVAAAVTMERLAPSGERAARVIGWLILAIGVALLARAAGA